MAFVYWIRHKDQGKHFDMEQHGYIGITSRTVAIRFSQHKYDAKKLLYPIHFAFQKHGDNLIVETLLESCLEYCQEVEHKLRPTKGIGYNCAIGGSSTTLGSTYSDEVRAKISIAAKGRVYTPQTRKRMSDSQKLRAPASQETRDKIGNSHRGKTMSAEAREKISKAHMGKKPAPFTQQHRDRIGASNTGRTLSQETREKMRIASTGVVKTQEAKDKFSLAMTGRNMWENSAARKDLWAAAEEFSEAIKLTPKNSAKKIALSLGYKSCNPWKLVDKIRAGWMPSEDEEWVAFKRQYKQKECNESTQTTKAYSVIV